jgi:uncharacterized membrane protein
MQQLGRQSARPSFLVLAVTTTNVVLLTYVLIDQGGRIAQCLYELYGKICHQGDAIWMFGTLLKLPLCYRCMGIHTFLFLGGWTYALILSRMNIKVSLLFLLLCASPMVVDALFGISVHLQSEIVRFVSGALFGFACIVCILQGLRPR